MRIMPKVEQTSTKGLTLPLPWATEGRFVVIWSHGGLGGVWGGPRVYSAGSIVLLIVMGLDQAQPISRSANSSGRVARSESHEVVIIENLSLAQL